MTRLEEIVERRRADVDERRRAIPMGDLCTQAVPANGRRDFAAALRSGTPAIVAEFKRSSPSAGLLAAGADPMRTVTAYELGGAQAISVVTEPAFFGGSIEDLRDVREATTLPVLCKDFVVDEYQIWEAAAAGADAVLLIAAVLDNSELGRFIQRAALLGMAAVVEVHDELEARRALRSRTAIIGVNNRDLRTFEVDLQTATRVRSSLPDRRIALAESGYSTAEDIAECHRAGFSAVLVGEALMRDADPEAAVRRLRAVLR